MPSHGRCFPQSQNKVTFITSPKEQSTVTFHCSWSFFLLLVFEAGPVGLDGLAATWSFFGVSFFFNPTFLLGEAWGSTVCSGWVSIEMDSS
jgi:hypothetical protein